MLKVGITGGIGSGKSTVCQVFETLGIPVFYADQASKYLLENEPSLRQAIIQLFGADAYKGKSLNRAYIAQTVFNDQEKLQQLNAISHPATIAYGESWMKQQNSPYVLKEAALFFESGSNKTMDKMIGVAAPLALRIQRTIERDKTDQDAVIERISKQMEQEEKMSRCDFVIINDEQQSIVKQVLNIHQELLRLEKRY